MNRTHKDKPHKIKYQSHRDDDFERVVILGFRWRIQLPTTKPKQRKRKDTEEHWLLTPMWWHRSRYTVPQRRKARDALKCLCCANLSEFDLPDTGRKPKIYYW